SIGLTLRLAEHLPVVVARELEAFAVINDFVRTLSAAEWAFSPALGFHGVHARRCNNHMIDVPIRRTRKVVKNPAVVGNEVIQFPADGLFPAESEPQVTALTEQTGQSYENPRIGDYSHRKVRNPNRWRGIDDIPDREEIGSAEDGKQGEAQTGQILNLPVQPLDFLPGGFAGLVERLFPIGPLRTPGRIPTTPQPNHDREQSQRQDREEREEDLNHQDGFSGLSTALAKGRRGFLARSSRIKRRENAAMPAEARVTITFQTGCSDP